MNYDRTRATISIIGVLACLGPSAVAAEQTPDQVVFNYLRALYVLPTQRSFNSPQYPDQTYCAAYALLSQKTQGLVSAQDFLSYARNTLGTLMDVDLSDPRVESDQATLRAKFVVRQYALTFPFFGQFDRVGNEIHLEFFKLVKESAGWRINLDDEQLALVAAKAKGYRDIVAKDVRFGLPPASCGS